MVSCAFWHAGDCDHTDDSMFILCSTLANIEDELYILHIGDSDVANDSMSILCPTLAIIECELYILAHWLL